MTLGTGRDLRTNKSAFKKKAIGQKRENQKLDRSTDFTRDNKTAEVNVQLDAETLREEAIAKRINWILRHGAVNVGLELDERGYSNCRDLVNLPGLHFRSVTMDDLRKLVSSRFSPDRQPRFHLTPLPSLAIIDQPDADNTNDLASPDESPKVNFYPAVNKDDLAHHLICAWDGHSLRLSSDGVMELLEMKDVPEQIVHATSEENWQKILQSGGLTPTAQRNSVHFLVNPSNANIRLPSGNTPVEKAVAGFRMDADLLVWVNAQRAAKHGDLKWWKSHKGVLITEGDYEGMVGMEWWDRVVRRTDGEVVWEAKEPWVELDTPTKLKHKNRPKTTKLLKKVQKT